MNLMQASRQWASRPQDQRFQTLQDLFNAVNGRRIRSRSADISLNSITAGVHENGNDIVLNHGIKSVLPTHWSFGQLSGVIHAPADYLRRLPAPLAVENINHGITKAEKDNLKFMSVVSDDPAQMNTLQAVTSTTYGRVWDADVVKCAMTIMEKTGNKFHNPPAYSPTTGKVEPSGLYASDRDCFIFMIDGGSILESGPRAQLNRGFFMWNSEVGARTVGIMTFLFNIVCGNHIVWDAQDIKELRIRHSSGGPWRFAAEAAPLLLNYANASTAPIKDAVKKAQDYLLPVTEKNEVIKWLQERKFTKSEAVNTFDTAVKEEGECRTLWHAIQGATAYARGFDYVDSRVEMETKAGNLLKIVGI